MALLVYIVKSLIDSMLLPARIFFATLFETLLLLTTLAFKIFWNATTAALLGAVDSSVIALQATLSISFNFARVSVAYFLTSSFELFKFFSQNVYNSMKVKSPAFGFGSVK